MIQKGMDVDTIVDITGISRELAISFINSVGKGIKKILESPKTWPIVEEDVRRHLINGFLLVYITRSRTITF